MPVFLFQLNTILRSVALVHVAFLKAEYKTYLTESGQQQYSDVICLRFVDFVENPVNKPREK